jgi:hypothetical protein
MRTLALESAKLRKAGMARVTRLFGTEDQRPIYESRRFNELSGADTREEYVNLMRWHLERTLDYRLHASVRAAEYARRPDVPHDLRDGQ